MIAGQSQGHTVSLRCMGQWVPLLNIACREQSRSQKNQHKGDAYEEDVDGCVWVGTVSVGARVRMVGWCRAPALQLGVAVDRDSPFFLGNARFISLAVFGDVLSKEVLLLFNEGQMGGERSSRSVMQ